MPEGMSIFGWIIIGLLAGVIAGWFVPGRERNGCLGTMLIGIIGGLLGGFRQRGDLPKHGFEDVRDCAIDVLADQVFGDDLGGGHGRDVWLSARLQMD